MTTPRLVDALVGAEVIHDEDVLDAAIEDMADAIHRDYVDGDVPLYVTIMHGGMPFAATLAFALGARGLDLQFDYLHATRYRGNTTGTAGRRIAATPWKSSRLLAATSSTRATR